MELTLATPALLFPAISLLLLAYTNRFLAVAQVIRALHAQVRAGQAEFLAEIESLRRRVALIRAMQGVGVRSAVGDDRFIRRKFSCRGRSPSGVRRCCAPLRTGRRLSSGLGPWVTTGGCPGVLGSSLSRQESLQGLGAEVGAARWMPQS